jgi:O-antigen/teichoic acid export membrane protein
MSEFVRKSLSLFNTRILLLAIGLVQSVIVARLLGPTMLGVVTIIMLIPNYSDKFGRLGLGHAATYMISSGNLSVRNVGDTLFLLSIVFGLVPLFVLPLYYHAFVEHLLSGYSVPVYILIILLASLPASFITNYFENILISYHDSASINRIRIISTVVGCITTIMLLLTTNIGYIAVLVGVIGANWIAASVTIIYYMGHGNGFPRAMMPDFGVLKKLWSYGKLLYLSIIINYFHFYLDILLISLFLPSAEVAYYKLGVGLLERIWLVPKSLSTLLFPAVASTSGSAGEYLAARVCRNTVSILLMCISILMIFADPLITLLYGVDFLPAVLPMRILGLGIVFMGISRILFTYFNGKGRTEINVYAPLLSMILNFVLNIILIPRYGIAGAAFASLISYILMAMVLLVLFVHMSQVSLRNTLVINKSDLAGYRKLAGAILFRR